MKFRIEKDDLLYAVSAVEKAVSGKNTLPVLSGIYLEAKDNQICFRATDLELAIECRIHAQVEEEGVLVAPGRKLSALVRLLPRAEITLSSKDMNLDVIYPGSSVQLPCYPPEDFPMLPKMNGQSSGLLPAAQFRRMVKQVSIAAAQDEVRPVFAGIYTEIDGDNIVFVATDTHRLAKAQGKWQGEGKTHLNIPSRVLQEVCRLAQNDDDMIQMSFSDSQVFFSFGDLLFTSRLIMGQYPDYRQVIPAENLFCTGLTLAKRPFGEALERAALIAGQSGNKANTVRLELKENSLHLCAEVPDQGRIDEEIPAEIQGETFTIGYNVKYLLDVLKILDTDSIQMRLTGMNTPGIITAAESDEDYLYLLLPVRMSR